MNFLSKSQWLETTQELMSQELTLDNNRYGPLNLPQNLHGLPDNYMHLLPKYDGEKEQTTEYHVTAFQGFTNNLFIEHDHVCMRLFVQTL